MAFIIKADKKEKAFSTKAFNTSVFATTENRTRNGALPLLYYTI